ncbi:uncharacterized protein LOC121732919 isoform X2 [Aricia agestis]|uniref:uncharacterized protein LOC121732919 isoform X2 n=1 Tax=Aricia agestis TaxID=91739 RepID=UPI001C20A4F4|nr:uncharacterized protein LOC121732919 isoform X2 [Aricia agestis]
MDIVEGKLIFSSANENQTVPTTTESFSLADSMGRHGEPQATFSPLATPFQTRVGNDLLTMGQEPRAADTAPATSEIEDVLMNLRLNNDMLFNDDHNNHNYFMGNSREPSTPTSNIWSEGGSRNGEMIDTFDFLIKSLSSANNYVSMLTREQLSVLRAIRPGLLYEFLQEVAKVRSDRRMRRALPNECAFCKNNGENEESYSSHALKDWRGRVLCPVLRAFRCPRCGATGDRAHTIKYCPDNGEPGMERTGSLLSRRRPSASLPIGTSRVCSAPATPAPSPAPNNFTSVWSAFGMN